MQSRRPFLAIHLLLALLNAASLNSAAQILPLKSYSVLDGLLSNDISCLFQDSQGYLWIASDAGVNVYDGRTFRAYTPDDGLPRSNVIRISEERSQGKGVAIVRRGWAGVPIEARQPTALPIQFSRAKSETVDRRAMGPALDRS